MKPISITAIASFSPLGNNQAMTWNNYLKSPALIKNYSLDGSVVPMARLPEELYNDVTALQKSDLRYKYLDDSVLYAILASREALKISAWTADDIFGINIGSSRGATQLFEEHYREYLQTGKARPQASPSTTLGNISSWVAQDLKSKGPEISHSVTCSTALHALLNGIAWLSAGMADKFLVGGSEAPLTPFTIAQMQAMKIYSAIQDEYPCRSLDIAKTRNSMVLGEGAAIACIEAGRKDHALAYIEGIGYSTEKLSHSVSISEDGECLRQSMTMALQNIAANEVDAVVMHAPGTKKGDLSEYAAVKSVFGDHMPLLTTNKWKIGHTLGSSGMLSLEMALLMLQQQHFLPVPYLASGAVGLKKPLQKILVNAVGFGGNAVSVLVGK